MYFQLENAKVKHEPQGLCSIDLPVGTAGVYPLVIAVHGSNRGAKDYEECPFYAEQKAIALRHGCAFGVISNCFDTWGTDDGLYNLKAFADYLLESYPVKKRVILWATSAGGVLANRMVKEYPHMVAGVIGTFPVYDLTSTFGLKTCRVGWRSKTEEEFLSNISGKNPPEFAHLLKGHKYYITHGTADTAVPVEQNSIKLKADLGENVVLQLIEGGVHSTANFAFYGETVERAFEELNK